MYEDNVKADAGEGDSPGSLGEEVVETYGQIKRFEPWEGADDVRGFFFDLCTRVNEFGDGKDPLEYVDYAVSAPITQC